MSSSPNPAGDASYAEVSSLPRWVIILFVVAFGLVGYLLYASISATQAMHKGLNDADKKSQMLASELSKTNGQVADLKAQLDVTSQKLGLTQDELARARGLAQSLKAEQQKKDAQFQQKLSQVEADTETKFGQVNSELGNTKTDVAATKADLEATKSKLQSTVGDLGVQSGLIARNHEEVQELKRLNERDIFEFTLEKNSKTPQHVGPIQVTVRKVDAKKYRFTMNVIADDKSIEK